jgi:hypothetical protein
VAPGGVPSLAFDWNPRPTLLRLLQNLFIVQSVL